MNKWEIVSTYLPVYEPYTIKKKKGGEYIVGTRTETPREYAPSFVPQKELLNDCKSLDIENKDTIIEFCNKYGLPGNVSYREILWHVYEVGRAGKIALNKEDAWIWEPISVFGRPVFNMPGGYSIFEWFRHSNYLWCITSIMGLVICINMSCNLLPIYESIDKVLTEGHFDFHYTKIANSDVPYFLAIWKKFWPGAKGSIMENFREVGDIYAPPYKKKRLKCAPFAMKLGDFREVMSVVQNAIKNYISEDFMDRHSAGNGIAHLMEGVRIGINASREGVITEYEFSSLPQFIGIRLYELLMSNKGLRSCKECGKLFIQTKKGQEFCPPAYPGKRSSCQNTHAVKKYRRKKTPKQKGKK